MFHKTEKKDSNRDSSSNWPWQIAKSISSNGLCYKLNRTIEILLNRMSASIDTDEWSHIAVQRRRNGFRSEGPLLHVRRLIFNVPLTFSLCPSPLAGWAQKGTCLPSLQNSPNLPTPAVIHYWLESAQAFAI